MQLMLAQTEIRTAPPGACCAGALWRPAGDRENTLLVSAFERRGGLFLAEELVPVLRQQVDRPLSVLAQWIVDRSVVSFTWRGAVWLPRFQFQADPLAVRPPVAAVLAELAGVFDDRELACWFAEPNSWLDGAAPMDVLDTCHSATLDAARADRFIALG